MPKSLHPKPSKRQDPPNDKLEQLRERVKSAPTDPGIYRWLDGSGTVMYVGKAKNLRNRLQQYVMPGRGSHGPWKESFLRQIADYEVTVVNNEMEALVLETNLIKELKPKYNVLMKDDKNYVYARITVQDPFPRIETVRKFDPKDGAKYFGPYGSAGDLWGTLTMLRKVYPFRTCKMTIIPGGEPEQPAEGAIVSRIPVEVTHKDRPTPCLDNHIGQCSAPCVGTRTTEEYARESIEGVMQFLKGDYNGVKNLLKVKMQQAAMEKKFEQAAQYRDDLTRVERLEERQQIATDTTGEDSDIFAVAVLSGRAHVCVLQRRMGKLIGDRCFVLSGHAEEDPAEVLVQFITQYYDDDTEVPALLLVSESLEEKSLLEEWLTGKRGTKVDIHLPERGRKSQLLELAEKNVQEKAKQHELKWEAEKRNTEEALRQLQDVLHLPDIPERIEGYDISHSSGTETVGSMSVIHKGKADSSLYRSFTIRTVKEGDIDDYKALKEVLSRRVRRLVEDLPAEEEKWKTEKGVTFGRGRKEDAPKLTECLSKENLTLEDVEPKEFLVARDKDGQIVGMARLWQRTPKIMEMKSLWVDPEERGDKLGQLLARKLLRPLKKGKVYILCKPELEEYYTEVGFRYVIDPPQLYRDQMLEAEKQGQPKKLVMMYDAVQNKVDPSLSRRPDLIMIDGGKGQLSSACEALEAFGLVIPIIGLAKREEEVFVPGHGDPIPFPPDSPAKFLLMRLRDEAHRFANRHRETRGKKKVFTSKLDEIPGIGDQTRQELLKKFGSIEGIRDASDEDLRAVVGDKQLRQLRESL